MKIEELLVSIDSDEQLKFTVHGIDGASAIQLSRPLVCKTFKLERADFQNTADGEEDRGDLILTFQRVDPPLDAGVE